nr:MAG TPA: hypothetical protein [Caudoviricetes sp.]
MVLAFQPRRFIFESLYFTDDNAVCCKSMKKEYLRVN